MLPEGWVKLTLSEACEMKAGKFVKAEDIAREPTEASYPCYGGNGLRGYTPSYTHDGCYPLIGRQGELCGNVMFAAGKFHATEHAVVVKAKDYTDTTWLYFKLVDLKLNRYATGQAQPGLSVKNLENISFIAPRCALEQKKIAQILSTWDNAISATERLLENSQQRKKGLMQQLLTGKKRLPGFEGEWQWLRANEVFRTVSKKNNGDHEELLAVTQDQGVLPRSLLERRVVMPDGSTSGYKLVVPRNFIISLRSFQGGLEYSEYRGLVSPAYTVLEPTREINDAFYKQYYKSYDFIGHLAVAVVGIRDGKQISYGDFSFLKIPYPDVGEQQAIANVLTTADQEIDALQKRLDHLKQEKKALMQQLLTGKRRVQVDDAA